MALFLNLTTKFNKVKDKYTSLSPCTFLVIWAIMVWQKASLVSKKKKLNHYIYSTIDSHLSPFDGERWQNPISSPIIFLRIAQKHILLSPLLHLSNKCNKDVLTVWNTFILDFQVFVCSRARIREDIRPRHHSTLGTIVAPAQGRNKKSTFKYKSVLEENKYTWACAKTNASAIILLLFETIHFILRAETRVCPYFDTLGQKEKKKFPWHSKCFRTLLQEHCCLPMNSSEYNNHWQ